MALPQFPSQDLAKLVLGYLAEEQLMTAYDEFLQASPYLDALSNEYDRILMASLRNIVAEYRAVKIYVETCKPFVLRKRLVQCTNLLEIVKFLANHIDLSRISHDPHEKTSSLHQHSGLSHKQNVCEECNLLSCGCKNKEKGNASHSQAERVTDTSVETASLEDLPGNQSQKKQVKILERDVRVSETVSRSSQNEKQALTVLTLSYQGPNLPIEQNDTALIGPMVKQSDVGCREKIQEFNDILNKVCKNKSTVDSRIVQGSFQEFAIGVSGHDSRNVPVPDSSTSENIAPQSTNIKDSNINTSSKNTKTDVELPKTNILFHHRIKPNDPKIKIISDIKVDKAYTMTNATSTPLVPSIVINGTPAYKPKLPIITKTNYTTDEIMAMPTYIVVTAADPSQNFTQTKALASQNTHLPTKNAPNAPETKLLGPLVIDISNNIANTIQKVIELKPLETQKSATDIGLVKTVDITKNASVPKDNIISSSIQSSTPDIPPPSRKSSSTPRRNSHIRVLDFATPRRILQETINENVPEDNVEQKVVENKTIDIIVSRSPNVIYPYPVEGKNNIIDMSSVQVHKIHTCHMNKIGTVSDTTKPIVNKKSNWDSELRLLVTANDKVDMVPKKSRPRSRQPKKKAEDTPADSKGSVTSEPKKSRAKRKTSPKAKKSKKRQKIEDEEEESVKPPENKITVKPNFNIVPANSKKNEQDNKIINDSNQSKHNKTDENNETPEAERLSLQNEIGAKLNISDLLETPYKQALYDIQMETPKFLGSVLPDEPVSDIKITSIPTPRFFDTPKPIQNTPSSYSSRPTDYSSGGSYYKPDEQDYLRVPELDCPVTSSKSEPINIDVEPTNEIVHEEKKSSRPIRKCAKNVSYYNIANAGNKTKDKISDNKVEIDTDSASGNSSFENVAVKVKTPKEVISKSTPKSSIKKRSELNKKKKSPSKRDKSNTFMKIKPRRLTPTKLSAAKRNRRKSDLKTDSSKKKPSGKERQIHVTPLVVPAPTKSRRKSSTPRKLHCSKIFISESSGHDSPEINASSSKPNVQIDQISTHSQDSDNEQIALRWSDDGSQDAKPKVAEAEDITKIQEYIITSAHQKTDYSSSTATLHVDLIKRGFDAETAKSIERDLLDNPDLNEPSTQTANISNNKEVSISKSVETDTSSNALQIVQDEESEDEFELSVHECNEDSENYIFCNNESDVIPNQQVTKLKDKFSMEVCIDDGVAIRLRATDLTNLINIDPSEEELAYSFKETEVAVRSISNIDKLYTPLKDHRAQVYEIFDSTLTSIDTPLKANSPRVTEFETTQIEIVIEEENVEVKDRSEAKKRKRLQSSTSSEEATNDSKKTKPEAQYLFNPTNIQNIDIESVLKKLHGP